MTLSHFRVPAAILLAVMSAATGRADVDLVGRLRWKNGDELSGRLVSASPDRLTWRSDALSQDVTLDLSVLSGVHGIAAAEPAESSDGPGSRYRVLLRDGMVLFGRLKAVTPEHIVLESDRHGETALHRHWIVSLQRNLPTGMIDLVGTSAEGWRSVDPRWVGKPSRLEDWDVSQPDRVTTKMPGGRLFLQTDLPALCDLELVLESTQRTAFSLALGAISHLKQRTGNLEIETWGDELVVTSPSSTKPLQFQHVDRLGSDTHSVTLRIFWHRETGNVIVIRPGQDVLAEASLAPAADLAGGGILLENKGADLTVKRLRINSWDGAEAPQIAESADRLRMSSGREYVGTISGPDPDGMIEVRLHDGETKKVPESDVVEIILISSDVEPGKRLPDAARARTCELQFYDGAVVRGTLEKVADGVATLRSGCAPQPMSCRLQGLKTLVFAEGMENDKPSFTHVLDYAGLKLRGTLARADSSLGWRLVGADTVIPLDLKSTLTIRRTDGDSQSAARDEAAGDILVLHTGEQLPCTVDGIDERFVEISTRFSAPARIPHGDVHAVVFDGSHARKMSGFDDGGWQLGGKQPNQIERRPDRVIFHDAASLFHPQVLAGGVLEFDVDWNRATQSYLMVTLSSDGKNRFEAGRGIVLRPDRQMFYLIFHESQVIVYVMEGNAFRQAVAQPVSRNVGPITVRIEVADNQVMLLVDGQERGNMVLSEEVPPPSGVTFQTQEVRQQNGQRGGELNLTISNLRAGGSTGLFRHLSVGGAARTHVLTVPRMRRDRPPSHVLVGRNGDLLRGHLLALNPSSVAFQSRLEDVVIPRDRLSAEGEASDSPSEPAGSEPASAEPAGSEPASAEPSGSEPSESEPLPPATPTSPATDTARVRATFRNGVVLDFVPERVDADVLVAHHPLLGECLLSLSGIDELQIGTLTAQADSIQPPLFTEWTLVHAREPVIPNDSGGFGTYSELVGKPAEDFSLKLLGGEDFRLSNHRGKVVVLDFWATWCGPCIDAVPQLIAATGQFPQDVVFVGVNQEELPETIMAFLEARGWDLTVALDRNGDVGRKYQVEGIPQTVVIDRDGTIAHVYLGSSVNLQAELTDVLQELVAEAPGGLSE